MSSIYQDHTALDRVHLSARFGVNSAVSGLSRPTYLPPKIVDVTMAQRAAICRDANCATSKTLSDSPS